jgi:hypothetical protein
VNFDFALFPGHASRYFDLSRWVVDIAFFSQGETESAEYQGAIFFSSVLHLLTGHCE